MHKVGRVSLVKSTLTAIPIYLLISIKLLAWAINAIDKYRRGFIWAGKETVAGRQCTMAWTKITRPHELGGLSITNLCIAGYAIQLQ